MEYFLQQKLKEDQKFKRYFDENTNYIKYFNRNPFYYKKFMHDMKVLYKETKADKINDAINTIEIINTVIDTIK